MNRNLYVLAGLVFAFAALFSVSRAAQIHVPADFPGIQSAINASANGDTIIVAPGRYIENIDFLGKAITLRSIDPSDPATVAETIIDGNRSGSCVTFRSGETESSVITGFTITNGRAEYGGGIICDHASPVIEGNTIVGNQAKGGGGVAFLASSTLINGCTVALNTGASFGGGRHPG